MDNSTKNKIEQLTNQLGLEIETLQNLVKKIDDNTQNRKNVAEMAVKSKRQRLLILVGAGVAAVLIICLSLLGAYRSGAEQRKLDSSVAASLKTAEKYIEDGDYDEAIALMEGVSEEATKYSDAQYLIVKATEAKENIVISDAETAVGSGDYKKAITILEAGIKSLNGSETLAIKEKEYIDMLVDDVVSTAQEQLSAENYQDGIAVLSDVKTFLVDFDVDLSDVDSKIGEISNAAKESMLAEAEELAKSGKYDDAISLLTDSASLYDDSDDEIQTALTNTQVEKVISEVTAYADAGNAEETLQYISSLSDSDREILEVQTIYEATVDSYAADVVAEAEELIGSEDYSSASTIIENALVFAPDSASLTEEKNVINSIQIEKEGFSGSMLQEGQQDEFEFTTPVAGRYRFDLIDNNANARVWVEVFDQNGEQKAGDRLSNGYGINADLEANSICKVVISYNDGQTDYTLKIGMPSPTVTIENFDDEIEGEITYVGQRDSYSFITPLAGRYRFEITDDNASARYYMTLVDDRNNEIFNDSFSGGSGVTVQLEANTQYLFKVHQKEDTARYWVKIWEPNPIEEIDNTVNEVSGSIKYVDQRNVYLYTAPVTGRYRISSSDNNANSNYRLYVYDDRNEQIANHDSLHGGDGLTVDLNAGTTYIMNLTYREGFCDYSLTFGVPNEIQTVTDNSFSGSITYIDQQDRYYFTPDETWNYLFSLGGGEEVLNRVYIFDSRDNQIVDNVISGGNDFRVDLNGGETYFIKVCFRDKTCDYSFGISKYVEPVE